MPLLITKDGRIISGNQRNKAADELDLKLVPVTFFGSSDKLDIVEAIVHANRAREKTKEQTAREAAALLQVEKERAKRRQKEAATKAGMKSGAARRGERRTTRTRFRNVPTLEMPATR